MSAPEVVYLHLDVRGVVAEVELNGFPLIRAATLPEGGGEAAAPLYLVPGENEVLLRVEPGSRPSLAETERRVLTREAAMAVAHLVRYPVGAQVLPENGTVLCKVEWAAQEPGGEVFPIERRGQAHAGPAFGRWSWQDAPVLRLDEALVTEARAVLEAYGHALCRGTPGEYRRLIDVMARETVRAFPAWPEAEQEQYVEGITAYYHGAPDPGFSLEPEHHDFRLVAGGRVLQCVDDDFQGSLRLRDPDGGRDVRMRVQLAMIDGALRPIR